MVNWSHCESIIKTKTLAQSLTLNFKSQNRRMVLVKYFGQIFWPLVDPCIRVNSDSYSHFFLSLTFEVTKTTKLSLIDVWTMNYIWSVFQLYNYWFYKQQLEQLSPCPQQRKFWSTVFEALWNWCLIFNIARALVNLIYQVVGWLRWAKAL